MSDEVQVKQRRGKTSEEDLLTEFCASSTIHGIKYIRGRPLREKLWWIVLFSVSICLCCFQIYSLYKKWERNPVVLSFDQKFSTVGDIPFPAVTICGQIFTTESSFLDVGGLLRDLQDANETVSEDTLDLLDMTSELCLRELDPDKKKLLNETLTARSGEIRPGSFELEWARKENAFLKCRGIVKPASWNCSEGFNRIVTQNGICQTFNMLRNGSILRDNVEFDFEDSQNDVSKWDSETGYASNNPFMEVSGKPDYPWRTFIAGKKLQIKIRNLPGSSMNCYAEPKVYIHHPQDLPWKSNSLVKLNRSKNNPIVVEPKVISGDLELQRSYSPSERKCYFEDERHLDLFRVYSESNCELECLTHISMKLCHCVAFWMPRPPGTRICGFNQLKCFTRKVYRYLSLEQASATFDPDNDYDIPFRCNCLPRCNSVTYVPDLKDGDTYSSDYEDDETEDEEDNLPIYVGKASVFRLAPVRNFVTFTVEFKDPQILPMLRSSLYGLSDFVAHCGGLLGLFMGVSILSIFEIIYFFGLRVFSR